MQWTAQQQAALDAVARWFQSGDSQVFRLFGYAGTGKTTLAKHFAEGAGRVLFGAFTGKAAHVLRAKGCPEASTLHSLIYRPRDRSHARLKELEEQLAELAAELSAERGGEAVPADDPDLAELRGEIELEKENLDRPLFELQLDSPVRDADLLVVDECSMIDETMGEDIMSFGTRVLALGDPFQLQPVRGSGYFTARRADMLLTDIQRQARDNPIIRLATDIREGRGLQVGEYGDSKVIPWASADAEVATTADQVLVGKNQFRRAMNARVRELTGRSDPLPVPGDRLVCLRNDHEVGLLNGAIWMVLHRHGDPGDDRINLGLRSEDGEQTVECEAHTAPFMGETIVPYLRRDAQEFDYGYALTTHKAQGSQWPRVTVFDQSGVFGRDSAKWLYTAVTRASESIIVAK